MQNHRPDAADDESPATLQQLSAEVRALRTALHETRTASRRRAKWALGVLATGALLGIAFSARQALSQATCTQTLPSGLKTFCPNTPAVAGDVNGNFQQLVTWVQQKVGTVGTNSVDVGGNATITGSLQSGQLA